MNYRCFTMPPGPGDDLLGHLV